MDYNDNEKRVEIRTNYAPIYILGFIVLVLAGVLGYNYYTYKMIKKKEFRENYIKKDSVSFDDLPSYVKNDYITKFDHNQQVRELNSQISKAGSLEPKEKIVEVEVEKIVEVEKPVEVYKSSAGEIDKSKFKSYGCYEMVDGDFYSSKKCIAELHDFLDKNKDAKLFEVIGVYNNEEFEAVKNIHDIDMKKDLKKIFNLAQAGLVEKRVEEGIWQVKNYLGFSTNVKKVNYDVKSEYGLKGFVVRAYK